MAEEQKEPKTVVKILPVRGRILAISLGSMLLGTCLADTCVVDGIEDGLAEINQTLQQNAPRLQQRDVVGGPEMDTFYEMQGERAYSTIDGRPVSSYVPRTQEESR